MGVHVGIGSGTAGWIVHGPTGSTGRDDRMFVEAVPWIVR